MTYRFCSPPWSLSRTLPGDQILDVVYKNLQNALTDQGSQRYDVPLSLRRFEPSVEDPPVMQVELARPGLIRMPVEILVSHVGGNVYDVCCTLDQDPAQRQIHGRPHFPNSEVSRSRPLGENLAHFLLDELERRVGRQRLRRSAIPLPPLLSTSSRSDASPSGKPLSS